ncbi:MAG: hypothetical protein LBD32_01355, partial [Cytophagales bacterium]|nr:hypothetical protein [Cytophagales bacterium]
DNKNEADPIKLLATVCKHFFLFNQTFFLSLRENLEKYEKKLNGGQVQNSVKAFIKLSKYLGNFVAKYEEMSEGFDDEQRVSFFFGNFLPQYFNIYHEHIFREEKDKNKGCTKCGLSLINAMQ